MASTAAALRLVPRVVRMSGVRGLVRHTVAYAYRCWLRPRLPTNGPISYNGIPVALGADHRWGDRLVPDTWKPRDLDDIPGYEAALVAELREHVRAGDRVVVVGGGVGVTVTVAAMLAGPTGQVLCYEGASENTAIVRQTAQLNKVADRVEVRHAVVARAISVYGTEPAGAVVDPATLPPCDVLELDCEGAEIQILRSLSTRPRVLLVESHGLYGASSAEVADVLREKGYVARIAGVAEPRLAEFCEANDIRIVIGEHAA